MCCLLLLPSFWLVYLKNTATPTSARTYPEGKDTRRPWLRCAQPARGLPAALAPAGAVCLFVCFVLVRVVVFQLHLLVVFRICFFFKHNKRITRGASNPKVIAPWPLCSRPTRRGRGLPAALALGRLTELFVCFVFPLIFLATVHKTRRAQKRIPKEEPLGTLAVPGMLAAFWPIGRLPAQ